MNRRRVARVITRLNVGGPSIHAITLSRELQNAGFSTCLIHGSLDAGEGDMTIFRPVGDLDAIHVQSLIRPISITHDVRALWRIYRAFCRWRPHVIHTHMAKAGAIGRLAGLLYNSTVGRRHPARLVHTYHGHVFEGYFGSPSTQAFLFIERSLGKRSDALIAISPQVRRDLLETYNIGRPNIVHLIPLGFNLDRFAAIDEPARAKARADLQILPEDIVVTTVGRLTAIKHHSLYLDAARRMAPTNPRLVFLVVGDGDLRAELEARAVTLGLGRRVRFLGWRGDLERIYAAADIFLLTSRNEGTPVALIEAMAAGVAPVSTDVGGVRDVFSGRNTGILVPVDDLDALCAAVLRFAASGELRRTVGAAARTAVLERYGLGRLLSDISTLYRELLRTA